MCIPTLPNPGSGKIFMFLRPSIFWNVMWHRLVVGYRRFGTAYPSHLQRPSSTLLGLLDP